MRVSKISYRRVKNLGNYETETVEAEMSLDAKDDPVEAYGELREFVIGRLMEDELTEDDYE